MGQNDQFPLPFDAAVPSRTAPAKPALPDARFNGPEYIPERDHARLGAQLRRIFDLMIDARWRTLDAIAEETGDPATSVSAQLRHLRKKRFGSHTLNRRQAGENGSGLFEYQIIVNRGTS